MKGVLPNADAVRSSRRYQHEARLRECKGHSLIGVARLAADLMGLMNSNLALAQSTYQ